MILPVLTPEQSTAWDRDAESHGIALATLMENAGRAAAAVLADRFPDRLQGGVLVATGLGNNGGDGWVIARALHRADVAVWVAPLAGEGSVLERLMAELARSDGVRVVSPDGPWPGAALVVDALLGTGARGAPRPPIQALIDRLNDLRVPVVAIDGPTGVDLQNGVTHGAAVRAALSITFGGLRRGHLLARDEVGDVVVVDIGHPQSDSAWPQLVTDQQSAEWLPVFRAADHKGQRGRVVIIGGDAGMTGAARLAGRAAFGAGAGLVHVVAPAETVQSLITAEPDLQTLAHPLEGEITAELQALLSRADALVIGPGLGRSAGRLEFILATVRLVKRAVIDADALHALGANSKSLLSLSRDREVLLTPHPGEFRTLFPANAGTMELDPWGAAAAASADCGATVLLKGVPSVVARDGQTTYTIAAGNPGLGTGGSGDLLSGITGTLLAQGLESDVAGALGGQILGRAADLAARRTTARGLRPMDVVASLPDLWRAWEMLRRVGPGPRPPVLFELERPQVW